MHIHLKTLVDQYQSEVQPFRKLHRMIDLFESIIKSHTVVIISSYVEHNKLSEIAKGMLAQGLKTPSLGTWQMFSRVLFEELQHEKYDWKMESFPNEFLELDKALNKDNTNVIAFRNGYAHGATPSDLKCEADIKKFEPFLKKILELNWLSHSTIELDKGKVFLSTEKGSLSLHPLLLFRDENSDASFAFFNDLKNDKIGLLNYPLGKHYREKDFYKEFHEYLPLQDWKKSGNNEFYQRIEELTETFKGRSAERSKLLKFVSEKHKGYLTIQGNPGIGKSALIAQFFKDLRANEGLKNVFAIEYFIRRDTAQAQVDYIFNYLIKRTDELFPQGREIRAEGKMVFDLQQQLFSKWRLWVEHSKGNKLLYLIDGLDEGVENNLVNYLPRENFENILIIYGSRPGGHKSIDDLWATLPSEHHSKLELTGLSKDDIRALIYEVSNKYEVERDSPWIDAVQQRSQGNPLYLKLLCDALENGSIALNDIKALPEKIDEYYKAILQRYAQDADGDALLAGLYTFAAAKDYLTLQHLDLINKLGDATLERVGSTLKEVLYENPLTEDVLDYQLFHESFREYLVKEKALKVTEATERILDFCSTWKDLEGSWEQRYALEHYALHLYENKKIARHTELLKLFQNKAYTSTQKRVLKQFDSEKDLYQLSLQKASELQHYDAQLEAALCLVDLKYIEANDAPQILALVANGEIDLALKRLESFGGNDKEGLQRKFILYMLCLMELTLLESKTMSFRKAFIEKLLKHFDEQIPVDHSILKWNDFFPSYTLFLMACEWAELGLDYMIVYKRTDGWETDFIEESGPYNDVQLEVLHSCSRDISSNQMKSQALSVIATELAKQGKADEAKSTMRDSFNCVRSISSDYWKNIALSFIATELAKQGKIDEAATNMQEALNGARSINSDYWKSNALSLIATELAKQGKLDESSSAMHEAITFARDISDFFWKSSALSVIATELAKQNKVEEALTYATEIYYNRAKNIAFMFIATELAKQGKTEEALTLARGLNFERSKSLAISGIATELAKQSKVDGAESVMQEALTCARGIRDESNKRRALLCIAIELANQGKNEKSSSVIIETILSARGIISDRLKVHSISVISSELAKKGKLDEAKSAMQEAISCASGIDDELIKTSALSVIATELAKQDKLDEALFCVRGISFEYTKSRALKDIVNELAKQGKVEEALTCAMGISSDYWKSRSLSGIATEFAKQGKIEEASSAMQEAFNCAMGLIDMRDKSRSLSGIATELVKQGKIKKASSAMKEAFNCAMGLIDMRDKSRSLSVIATELVKQGKADEALTCARGISHEPAKRSALLGIAKELANQGNWAIAETTGLEISQLAARHSTWKTIAGNNYKALGWQKALQQVNQLQSDEARLFYFKGWAEAVSQDETDAVCVQEALSHLAHDSESIENLLQKYALYELFFGTDNEELVKRLNKSLNIQWAIDIKAQFNREEEGTRLSTNVDEWLHEITDEDDQERVELWAMKVAKGKMTEQDFTKKINSIKY